MSKIKVTQIRSKINSTPQQKKNLEALGLRGIGKERIHENSPNILGMINKVKHLVSVEETK
ncbi:MAG TPA: 50S ribosomal protein L30 [Flavobacteriaceae bacterium]|nr:50S ribosomal protein L30 [Flavobacteriaceae bacterium]